MNDTLRFNGVSIPRLQMKRSSSRQHTDNNKTSNNMNLKIFIKDVRDNNLRRTQSILVSPWSTIQHIKGIIDEIKNIPPSEQRLFYGPIGVVKAASRKRCNRILELPNHYTLRDVGITMSGQMILMDVKPSYLYSSTPSNEDESIGITMLRSGKFCSSDVCVASSVLDLTPKPMRKIVHLARQGFAFGLKPELGIDGSGGTYFLRDPRSKSKVAVFKPSDEEPYASNNPRGYLNMSSGSGDNDMFLREGVTPGEACIREVAAYLLDHCGSGSDGFSSVPMTTLVEARHPNFNVNGKHLTVAEGGAALGLHSISTQKLGQDIEYNKIGSCQEFVYAECTMDDLSPSKITVEEVHKIAILDIRIMNADRNSANLLCRRRQDDSIELVPIDHGFCLRSECDVAWFDWCWLDWPHLKEPMSESTKSYIRSLDVEADCQLLEERLHLDKKSLNIFRASTNLLKAGTEAGLSLYNIARLCSRYDDAGEIKSRLEVLISMAGEISSAAVQNGKWDHVVASKALEAQLSPPSSFQSGFRIPSGKLKTSRSTSMFVMEGFDFGDDNEEEEEINAVPMSSSPSPPSESVSTCSVCSDDYIDEAFYQCNNWAASFIDQVETDNVNLRRDRSESSVSVSSRSSDDDNSSYLSSSPQGFWTKRPDSIEYSTPKQVTWSPSTSPAESFFLSTKKNQLPFQPRPKSATNTRTKSHSNDVPSKVTLDSSSFLPFSSLSKQPVGSGITRCKSYSAISSFSSSESKNKTSMEQDISKGVEYHHQYNDYFQKFVDLLIKREILQASRYEND
mmetsp:Transcript_6190/g.8180  ORF Transcript_6190/g.8180 Transcript_6190/m.8180 type:complete len:792 (-) Transcript_6190:206-2581(-)